MIALHMHPRLASILAVTLLALAACQGAPKPYAGDHPPTSAALTPPDSAGILVLPPTGAPPALAADLAQAMAGALQDADVPASTEAYNRGSYRLTSSVTTAPTVTGIVISVDWQLTGADGSKLGGAASRTEPDDAALSKSGDLVAKALAAPAVPAILKLVEGGAPLPQGEVNPVVSLRDVQGAPGDGDGALARAMGEALKRVNVAMVDGADAHHDFLLAGSVEVLAPEGTKQQVKVSWALLRPDGSEVGRVNQQNTVVAGSLNGAWGDVAYAVTAAAAPGVKQLIERAPPGTGG
jgi:hypothetical protein